MRGDLWNFNWKILSFLVAFVFLKYLLFCLSKQRGILLNEMDFEVDVWHWVGVCGRVVAILKSSRSLFRFVLFSSVGGGNGPSGTCPAVWPVSSPLKPNDPHEYLGLRIIFWLTINFQMINACQILGGNLTSSCPGSCHQTHGFRVFPVLWVRTWKLKKLTLLKQLFIMSCGGVRTLQSYFLMHGLFLIFLESDLNRHLP